MAMPSQRFSLTWVLNLFGTAVGAGVLFLPINAGMGGFYPLIIMTLLVGPMTYLAHRGLTRFVLSSKYKGSDITAVVREHFGEQAGKLITLLYFFAIFPILLIYGVGITNTVSSFMENQLHIAPPSRAVLSFMLIAAMIGVMLLSEQVMLKITTCLVYPLVLILLGLSIYLIPQWNTAALQQMPTTGDFLTTLWLTI
ncbi:TPA: serine transporter, partial [Mannheimia haemolytica]|nr:serine transporter [Mannheimia haemolytica]